MECQIARAVSIRACQITYHCAYSRIVQPFGISEQYISFAKSPPIHIGELLSRMNNITMVGDIIGQGLHIKEPATTCDVNL